MARNGSGTYSIPNSFSSGSTIRSSEFNTNFTDIASELTNSLPRDGQAGMTGQLKASSGTASLPSMTFSSDPNTGFYSAGADTIGVAAGGAQVATISTSGFVDSNSNVIVGIPTGVMMMYGATTAPTGWVRCNARTIGDASSSATERANADTANLFTFLWTNFSDTVCPVSGGRGGSAAADYAAHKTIGLPDLRGRAVFGLDDMGNSAASRVTSGGSGITGTANGSGGGAETRRIAQANLPNAALTGTTSSDGAHTHDVKFASTSTYQIGGAGTAVQNILSAGANTGSAAAASNGAHTHTFTTSSINGGVTQTTTNNMPPCFLTTYIIKL